MHKRNSNSRVPQRVARLASIAVVLTLVGCGISGQKSQAPGSSTGPAVTSAAGTQAASTPGGVAASTGPASSPQAPASGGGSLHTANPSLIPSFSAGPATPQPTIAGTVSWANWPVYIDTAGGKYPTIDQFTSDSGIAVQYHEDINDNSEFFGKIQPDLQAGRSTTYDVITPSDWMVAKMIRLGYLQPLDKSLLPNWAANAQPDLMNPWYDPGNTYSIPWQAGIVGIGYNPKLTGREITSFDDLLDPAFAGRVGMFSEMIDTMSLALLSNGVKPEDSTIDDVTAAQQKLLTAAQAGQFRKFYGNDYYDALAGGDVAISMAWSGDISQMQLFDNPDVKFVIPSTGGLLFVDNMVIPNFAEHPADAYKLMDYWYTLPAAVPLSEYIGYFSPVKGVQEAITADAQAAAADGKQIRADHLTQIAHDSFPTPEELANVYNYKNLTEDEERQWNDLFDVVVNG